MEPLLEGHMIIEVEEYDSLKKDSELLKVLQEKGVDNWEGWEEALSEYLSKTGD